MRGQPLIRFCSVIGKRAHDFAVVVAKIREAVRLDHRPIGEIPEQQIGGIHDPILFLGTGPAAERYRAAAHHGMAACVLFRLDHDDRSSGLLCNDRRRQAEGARADHHDVRFQIPRIRGSPRCGGGRSQRQCADTQGTSDDKIPAGHRPLDVRVIHQRILWLLDLSAPNSRLRQFVAIRLKFFPVCGEIRAAVGTHVTRRARLAGCRTKCRCSRGCARNEDASRTDEHECGDSTEDPYISLSWIRWHGYFRS